EAERQVPLLRDPGGAGRAAVLGATLARGRPGRGPLPAPRAPCPYPSGPPASLLLALLIYTIRPRPGPSAAAGFVVGLVRDALTPASFGAGALAHTLVGYLSSWSKAVFFAENLLVNGCLFFAGTWCRNLAVALASGKLKGGMLGWELLVWSPIQSLTTAVAGVLVLWL